jgi:hypothetical protein
MGMETEDISDRNNKHVENINRELFYKNLIKDNRSQVPRGYGPQ